MGAPRRAQYEEKMRQLQALKKKFAGECVMPGSDLDGAPELKLRKETTLLDALRRPEVTADGVAAALSVDTQNEAAINVLRQLEAKQSTLGT